MIDRVILHIGLHHTGTTSFQTFLNRYRDELNAQGFQVYQPLNDGINAAEITAAAQTSRAPRHVADVKKTIHDQCENAASHTLLMSAESLSNLSSCEDVGNLKSLFPSRIKNIMIILVLRDPVEWMERRVRGLKKFNDARKDVFPMDQEHALQLFRKIENAYREKFENVHVINYQKNMVVCLCEICGIKSESLNVDLRFHETTRLKRYFQKYLPAILDVYSKYLARSGIGRLKRKIFNE